MAALRRATYLRWALLGIAVAALILVPFFLFGRRLDVWSVTHLGAVADRQVAVAALIIALLAVDVLLPVPSSVVATLSGALLGLPLGAAATWVGMTGGCFLAYGIGHYAGEPLAVQVMGGQEVARLRNAAARHGDWGLVLSRAVPVLAETSTLLAGAGAIPVRRFLMVTGAANLGIALTYATVGAFAASVHSFLLAVAGAVLVPLAGKLLLRGRP